MIELLPLGAGQDVGRSCIIVRMGGKTIMLDCGMHMGYKDSRRFPNFALLAPYASSSSSMTSTATVTAADGSSVATPNINYTALIDCVIISHFHLDHSGALPHFTEQCGYDGPIYMTDPTRAISAILLNDFRKIQSNKRDEQGFFTENDIKNCMRKVITVQLHETVHVDDDLEIRAYYAGHVLGAAMFHLKVKSTGETLVYTGDYNMTPDRHLGSAWIDRVNPDVLITESTYATTVRDSRRAHERDFVTKVHNCVKGGGKVLIPVFALGRAQELCILLDSYWDRMNLGHIPVYFSAGLTEKANNYYKLFINWTNQKVKDTFVERNIFDFKHIRSWDPTLVDSTGPMVLFASPGMLHQGTSLDVFKKWAPFENNMVIMPGYCVAGTVGYHVLQGVNPIKLDQFNVIQVNLKVECLSFSAHADAKGIMQLIRQSGARHVVLVHGEKQKMGFLQGKIEREFGIPCSYPANGESCKIETRVNVGVLVESEVFRRAWDQQAEPVRQLVRKMVGHSDINEVTEQQSVEHVTEAERQKILGLIKPINHVPLQGIAVQHQKQQQQQQQQPTPPLSDTSSPDSPSQSHRSQKASVIVGAEEASSMLPHFPEELIVFNVKRAVPLSSSSLTPSDADLSTRTDFILGLVFGALKQILPSVDDTNQQPANASYVSLQPQKRTITFRSFVISVALSESNEANLEIQWALADDVFAKSILGKVDNVLASLN